MRKLIFLVLMVFCLTGCSAMSYRTNKEFGDYFKVKKDVAILSPDMKIFRLTAGGVDQYQDGWSNASISFMREQLERELDTFDTIRFESLDDRSLSTADKDFLDEQKGIYYAVSHSVVTHTYEPATLFKHKVKNFDYTMGDELNRFKDIKDVDAILFVNGRNYIWTAGRASLALISGAVGAFTGVTLPVPAGKEWLTASLVEVRTGNILWFNYLPMPGDMRKEKTVRRLTKKLFRDFPDDWRNEERWKARRGERYENAN